MNISILYIKMLLLVSTSFLNISIKARASRIGNLRQLSLCPNVRLLRTPLQHVSATCPASHSRFGNMETKFGLRTSKWAVLKIYTTLVVSVVKDLVIKYNIVLVLFTKLAMSHYHFMFCVMYYLPRSFYLSTSLILLFLNLYTIPRLDFPT